MEHTKRFWEKNKITNVINWINNATEKNGENDNVVTWLSGLITN
jgi:hypothetical protein